MKRFVMVVMMIGCIVLISSFALAGNFTLSGKQTAGSGHAKNANRKR